MIIIKPTVPIKPMLEKDGYPFKSKYHSKIVDLYQKYGIEQSKSVQYYLELATPESGIPKNKEHLCPKLLKYQFTEDFKLKVSDKCCNRLKKEPMEKWKKENNKKYTIIGIMAAEGGQRETAQCLSFKGNKLKAFQPLAPMTKEWEDWFIETYHIDISDIYKPPYNFHRTGCKGCPFNPKLQRELDTLDKYFPRERKQCEIIWHPVYEEYRRLKYRMRTEGSGRQMELDEFLY